MQNNVDFSDVFNVTNDELRSIISKAVEVDNFKSFEIVEKNDLEGYKGYCGEKLVINVRYELLDGSTGEVRIFVKKLHWDTIQESIHFKTCERLNLPTPKLYGCVKTPDGQEVLFMECLKNTCVDKNNRGEFLKWLQLMAQINASDVPVLYLENAWKDNSLDDIKGLQLVLEKIWRYGLNGEIGESIGRICSEHSLDSLMRFVQTVVQRCECYPKSLIHGEPASQNYGYGDDKIKLMFFDLHKFRVSYRFSDICSELLMLKDSPNTCISFEEAASFYIEEYYKKSRIKLELSEFIEELEWVESDFILRKLFWFIDRSIDGKVDWTDDIIEGQKANREWLYDDLNRLISRMLK
ncbi:MAG: hypothetical protein WCQ41_00950 [Bacillota bacterium]